MPFAEDLAPFFADFGVDGTLAGAPVRVIFDAAGARGGPESGLVASDPQVTIATASVTASPHGATLVVPAGTFKVREHLPDGTGTSVLTLTKA